MSTGSIGFQGSRGFTGTIGINGFTGCTGWLGGRGDTGTLSVSGSGGVLGPYGVYGPNGADGQEGCIGSSPIGAAGTNGCLGTDNMYGTSGTIGGYGCVGTDTMHGTSGPIGGGGCLGTDTMYGTYGNAGFVGVIGPFGVDGYTGPTEGVTGPVSIGGPAGFTGIMGLTGAPSSIDAKGQCPNLTVPTGNSTIVFSQIYDSADYYNPSTGVFTASSDGYYTVQGCVYVTNATANTSVQTMVIKNNDVNANAEYLYERIGTGSTRWFTYSTVVQCNQNDTLRIRVFNGSGSNQQLGPQNRYNSFSVAKI